MPKVAGLNVWESSGSGLNTEIGARGLNPARSSNFNVRQNQMILQPMPLDIPMRITSHPLKPSSASISFVEHLHFNMDRNLEGRLTIISQRCKMLSGWRHEIRSSIGSFGLYNQSLGVGYGGDKVAFYTFWELQTR